MKILFVCSSNVCRSPYCEYVFRELLKNSKIPEGEITVSSSAVFNQMKKIDDKTRRTLIEKEGFDPSYVDSHKPGLMWLELPKFNEADVIIGMTKSHRIMLLPKYRSKFMTLSEAAVGRYEAIPDPWLEKDINKYFDAMNKLKEYMKLYLKKLEEKY